MDGYICNEVIQDGDSTVGKNDDAKLSKRRFGVLLTRIDLIWIMRQDLQILISDFKKTLAGDWLAELVQEQSWSLSSEHTVRPSVSPIYRRLNHHYTMNEARHDLNFCAIFNLIGCSRSNCEIMILLCVPDRPLRGLILLWSTLQRWNAKTNYKTVVSFYVESWCELLWVILMRAFPDLYCLSDLSQFVYVICPAT